MDQQHIWYSGVVLKVICQGLKGQIWLFNTFCKSAPKRSDNVSLFCAYSFLGMTLINCQEMDLITMIRKVIFNVETVRFGPFTIINYIIL